MATGKQRDPAGCAGTTAGTEKEDTAGKGREAVVRKMTGEEKAPHERNVRSSLSTLGVGGLLATTECPGPEGETLRKSLAPMEAGQGQHAASTDSAKHFLAH
jgi:hypothetical protein